MAQFGLAQINDPYLRQLEFFPNASEIFLTDEALTSLAKRVPDILDYTDANPYIDYSVDVNAQLYDLFGIKKPEQDYIKSVFVKKK